MSQIHSHAHGSNENDDEFEAVTGAGQIQASIASSDDLLDEIDLVLESNAESFVKSFVQKGGE